MAADKRGIDWRLYRRVYWGVAYRYCSICSAAVTCAVVGLVVCVDKEWTALAISGRVLLAM